MKPKDLSLHDPVAETLLIPLVYRAVESQLPNPLLYDQQACRIVKDLQINLSLQKGRNFAQTMGVLRARKFDEWTRAFLTQHPKSVVVEIGCGLDGRFERVDNGQVESYNLDLPEVINLRQQLMPDHGRCRSVACSVLDAQWMNEIPQVGPHLFLAEGVFPYFTQEETRWVLTEIARRFPGSEMVLDILSPLMVRISGPNPTLRGYQARPKWSVSNPAWLESWQGVCLLEAWGYFDHPEPRLRNYRFYGKLPFLREMARVVHLKLGESIVG